jgi:toxin ParE1/3/4
MAFEVVVKPQAWFDLVGAMLWYDSKRQNLGREFFNDFEVAIERIKTNPNAFREIMPEVKRILIKRFPYKVFYTVTENTIYIIGVAHAQRSNTFVKKRLKGKR